ncbi:MAG: membrane protein insertion efficiency factor YidD [Planctomycetaceae bacterium]
MQSITAVPGLIVILLIRGYQTFLSPLVGRNCRFHPTCSQYFIEAVRKYGLVIGSWKGIRRISRCHPWNDGGFDPP